MKKLILTGCAAALFCIGSIAQVQDSTSNNFRQGDQDNKVPKIPPTSQQMEQGADSKSQMDSSSPSPNATDMGANAQPPMQEIEV